MAFSAPGKFRMSRLDLGLISKWPATSLPPGALQAATNLRLDGQKLGSGIGHTRITSAAPDDLTYKLDGNSQFFRGKVTTTTNQFNLRQGTWTLEFVFRTDSNRAYQFVMAKAEGQVTPENDWTGGVPNNDFSAAVNEVSWAIYLRPRVSDGQLALYYYVWNGVATEQCYEFGGGGGTVITPGVYYHAVITRATTGFGQYDLYCHQVGTTIGTANTQAG